MLRKIISEQVAAMFVLPNKFSIPLCAEVPAESIKTPEPEVSNLLFNFYVP